MNSGIGEELSDGIDKDRLMFFFPTPPAEERVIYIYDTHHQELFIKDINIITLSKIILRKNMFLLSNVLKRKLRYLSIQKHNLTLVFQQFQCDSSIQISILIHLSFFGYHYMNLVHHIFQQKHFVKKVP